MLRKLMVVALVLTLSVFALVACGGGVETETQAPETQAPETQAPETQAPETEPEETEHVHDLEIEDVLATCQRRGYHKEICKTCGEVVVENAYPKTACTPIAAVTCTEDSVCSVCNGVIETAKGHTFGEAQVTAATCEAEGKSVSTCSVCGTAEETVLAKVAHNIPDENVTASTESTTCGVPATKTGLCTLCNRTVTVDLGPLPHTFVLEQVDVAADGTLTAPCDACGKAVVMTKETRLKLDFDGASLEEEFEALGLAGKAALFNDKNSCKVATFGDRSVLDQTIWNGVSWIELDPSFLNDAAYYSIAFDFCVGKATSDGGPMSVFGAVPGARSATGAQEFSNIAKYDRATGWLRNGDTRVDEQYMQLEVGKFYHFEILVDNTSAAGLAHLYVDGIYLCSKAFYPINQEMGELYAGKLGFRIGEHGNTHDPFYDNFSISAVK